MEGDVLFRERLEAHRAGLASLSPQWSELGQFEAWVAGFRLFLSKMLPDVSPVFDGLAALPTSVKLVGIVGEGFERKKQNLNDQRVRTYQDKLLTFIDKLLAETMGPPQASPDPHKVFVIHGRNLRARDAMFTFLRAIDLNPIEWSEAIKRTGKAAPYIGEILDAAFQDAQAVVAVLTGDDMVSLREEFWEPHDPDFEKRLTPQARPNVLFEAGMAFGRHPERTIMIQIGQVRPFSDLAGRHVIQFKGGPPDRQQLKDRLATANCAIKDGGIDWLNAGDFENAIALTAQSRAQRRSQSVSRRRGTGSPPKKQSKLIIELDQLGPSGSGGPPENRRTDFRVRLRITNPTDRNVTLVEVHSFVKTHDGRILDVPYPDAQDRTVQQKDGSITITGLTPTMLAREGQVPRLGLVTIRVAGYPSPINKVFDEDIAREVRV
jgi:predicted nucleotide-binding protein